MSWLLKEEENRKKEILTRTTSVAAALCNVFVQMNNKEMDNMIEAIFKFVCEFFISVGQWVNCMGNVLNSCITNNYNSTYISTMYTNVIHSLVRT